MVQLIHHHSQAADGLICPLLYPAARREQPSLLRGTASSGGAIEGCAGGGGGCVGLDDWEIDRSEIMMRNKLGELALPLWLVGWSVESVSHRFSLY